MVKKMLRALQLLLTFSRSAALRISALDGRINIKSSQDFLLQIFSADSLTSTSWITSRKVTGLPQASTATFIFGAAEVAEAAVSVAALSPSAATITLVEGRRHFPPRI